MPSPLIAQAMWRASRRRGFTLIEILVAVAVAALVLLGLVALSRATTTASSGALTRTNTAALKQRLDARIGEIVRVAPQLGDLQFTSPTVLSYRKREATGAYVCAYNGSAVTVVLTAAEVSELAVGDSLMVRVGQATADTTDDAWKVAPLTSVATAAACGKTPTLSVTLPAPAPSSGSIGNGASVRFWSTRRYASTQISTDSGYALVETVNGAGAVRMFAPYAASTVFEYLDGTGAPAASAAATRLVRATVQPYAWRDGERVTLLRETFEWPVRVDDDPTMVGSMLPVLGATTAVARCTDPSALNFGDTRNACEYPTWCTAPTSETQTLSCLSTYGAGWSGNFAQQRDKNPWPDCSWGAWVTTSSSCVYTPPTCAAPTSETQTLACSSRYGASYLGNIYQQRDKSAYPGCVWGAWYDTGDDCYVASCPAPTSQTQTIACSSRYGAGWTGSIWQQQDKSAYPTCSWGAWYDTGDNCALCGGLPASEQQTVACGAPYSGNKTQQRDLNTGNCTYGGWYDIDTSGCVMAFTPCPYNGAISIDDPGCTSSSCFSYSSRFYSNADNFSDSFYSRYATANGYGTLIADSGWYLSGQLFSSYDLDMGWAYSAWGDACGTPISSP
ncbi:MAG: prepilin-type N-terminal cleavage/methylation domain-containing protein [Gemmatimonadaceae bacterium]|nr:prepilin-type N-terminal cleavage/methylation domain-containing protein [Gemmatimonadaceae bacterium]